jgi:DNA-binding NarL/FixJ family response regulator
MVRAVIVEGNPPFRQALKNIFLSRFPSVALGEAANGKEAIDLVETLPPDLILIDIKLPDDNALELTQKIKTRCQKVVVILLGSYDLPEYREMACLHGADYFIPKDSPVEDYLALIESILST